MPGAFRLGKHHVENLRPTATKNRFGLAFFRLGLWTLYEKIRPGQAQAKASARVCISKSLRAKPLPRALRDGWRNEERKYLVTLRKSQAAHRLAGITRITRCFEGEQDICLTPLYGDDKTRICPIIEVLYLFA
ncbi:MAG: hypothetical protein JWL77_1957 [Chthonomonadaceae bacterium]|nr:hypothetical protein [Chthonomonadaceae bacterium]